MQDELKLGPMPVHSMRYADLAVVGACQHAQDAVDLAHLMARPRRTIRDRTTRGKVTEPGWATMMNCSIGEASKRLHHRFADALEQIRDFERDAHNVAITQWLAREQGGVMVPREANHPDVPDSSGRSEEDMIGAYVYGRRHGDKEVAA